MPAPASEQCRHPASHTSSTRIISHSLLILTCHSHLSPREGSNPTGLGPVNHPPGDILSSWPLHTDLSPPISRRCSCLLIQRTQWLAVPLIPQDIPLSPQIPSHGKKTKPRQAPGPVLIGRASWPCLLRAGPAQGPTRPPSSVQVLREHQAFGVVTLYRGSFCFCSHPWAYPRHRSPCLWCLRPLTFISSAHGSRLVSSQECFCA